MANKILPIVKQQTIDYSAVEQENFWMLKGNITFSQSDHKAKFKQLLENVREGIVCIYSEKFTDKDLIEVVFNISNTIRCYILVKEYSNELDMLKGKALIRYSGVKILGSFMLVNPNSNFPQGVFYAGQLTEPSLLIEHISFVVKKEEISELFRHFCYQFWEKAKIEIIDSGGPKNVETKPIDIYYDDDKFKGKDYVYGTLFDFIEKIERCKLSGQKIILLNQENQLPIEIISDSVKDIGDFTMRELLPMEEFEKRKPDFNDDGHSVNIQFSWRNIPFYLPENANEHNLYSQWQTEMKKIENKLSSLLNNIVELENKEKTLSKKVTRFFLGKKTQLSDVKAQIFEIQKIDFSNISKDKRDNFIEKINYLSSQIEQDGKEIDSENKKALIDEQIDELQNQLLQKKREFEELPMPQDEKFKGKYEDDKRKLEKEIEGLENSIKSKAKEKEKIDPISENIERSSLVIHNGNKQHQQNNAKTFAIQNLPQLPQIGELFSENGKNYLAIENWEDFEVGKIESERLNAKLCAIK